MKKNSAGTVRKIGRVTYKFRRGAGEVSQGEFGVGCIMDNGSRSFGEIGIRKRVPLA